MTLVLAAHGTRRASGVAMIGDLATRVSELMSRPVRVAFVDVLGPTPSEVLGELATHHPGPAVVVPAFLSRGYHVRTDLPEHIAVSGHPDVTVTPALGPSSDIARILHQQLVQFGWQPGDSVILAAAGTSDPLARNDLHTTAELLSALTGTPVALGFAATGSPSVRQAVAAARRHGTHRVVVASYLLADGLFQQRLHTSGADLVTEPLGTHPGLPQLIANRFRRAAAHRSTARRPVRRPNCVEHNGLLHWRAPTSGA
ncbi:sirohydrochlorin chelatase [Mycobacterium sp. 1423905.2]|uniref:sirohydrochlorin chelatase n=1 Tax=Mycobacterium sp. 1423905.2 TaxID=1856859 RepID=UPI000800147E|nr:sirohydrochlorin chelatase [Mycobacterium sp. 1423905.2]OBJ55067.1 cobalamin biosynthesis protein CbiX [Mycobacterium sp. 1423905.2]